jgi:MFS family permease
MSHSGQVVSPMTGSEKRAAVGLSAIFALRMLGLFLILPVFALHAKDLVGTTPLLTGLAVGAYGLTQALLQIPFGMISDRIGRKPVIFVGLALFTIGSVIAAMSVSIYGVILGRVLQGSGAIAAAVTALTADLTREEVRTRAMAGIGLSIGLAFALALVLGPAIAHGFGLSGVFWFTAILAAAGILILAFVVPDPDRSSVHRDVEAVADQFLGIIRNTELLRLDFGIFTLHMVMISLFLVVPLNIKAAGLPPGHHWWLYMPVLAVSVLAMVPFIILAESKGHMKGVFVTAVAMLAASLGGLALFHKGLVEIALFLFVFFTAVNLLEATLPSLVAKLAPAGTKGTAMGAFSTSQFTGAFLGGLLGGWVHQRLGEQAVLLFCAGAAGLWFLVARSMARPQGFATQVIRVGDLAGGDAASIQRRLLDIPGVEEAVVVAEEGLAYLKVDNRRLDWARLQAVSAHP